MIQGAVIRVIGVVLGLFVIFSVVSPVAGGLNELYLHSVSACNFGSDENPARAIKFGHLNDFTNSGWDADAVDWTNSERVMTFQEITGGTVPQCGVQPSFI